MRKANRRGRAQPSNTSRAVKEPAVDKPKRDFSRLLPHAAVCGALAALILLAWSNSFGGGFVFDNRSVILLDSRVHEATAENVGLILHHSYWATKYEAGLYRPLTTLSYLFNYAILGNGGRPAGYHVINLCLHILNAFLVYALAFHFMRKLWVAAFAAALWAVHPVLTEAVTNIVGRADLLATAGVLGGFLMYLKGADTEGWRKWMWLGGLLVATTLGVFSKESAVVIIGAIVLYEMVWWKERKQWRGLLLGCAAVMPPLLLLAYARSAALGTAPPAISNFLDNPIIGTSLLRGRLTALAVMGRYLWLLVWPVKLSADYSYNQVPLATGSVQDWLAWGTLLAAVLGVAAAFRRNREAFFFAGFGFLAFLSVSNLFFNTGTIMAERLLYMPAIGFAVCVTLAAFWASRGMGRKNIAPTGLCVIVIILGVRTWKRNDDWLNDQTLWTATVRASPNSYKAHASLAEAIYENHKDDLTASELNQIIGEAEKVLAIVAPVPESMNSAAAYEFGGNMFMIEGDRLEGHAPGGQTSDTPQSLLAYRKAREIFSRGAAIDRAFNADYRASQLAQGKTTEQIAPAGRESLYYAIAANDLRLKANGDAAAAAAYAIVLAPEYSQAYQEMGTALLREGNTSEAALAFMEGLLISGDKNFLPSLRATYASGLDTTGCAFTSGSDFPNPSCGLVHDNICKAASRLIQLLNGAGEASDADKMRSQALEESGCTPDELR
jgi:hypothetical protein